MYILYTRIIVSKTTLDECASLKHTLTELPNNLFCLEC